MVTNLRTLLKELLISELDQAEKLLQQCTLEQRVALFTKLSSLLIPKQTADEAKQQEKPDDEVELVTLDIDGKHEKEKPPPLSAKIKAQLKKLKPGRPKGSLNKKNRDARQRWTQIFLSEYDYIAPRLQDLSPHLRLNFLLKISPIVIPRETAKSLREKEGEKLQTLIMHLGLDQEPTIHTFKRVALK